MHRTRASQRFNQVPATADEDGGKAAAHTAMSFVINSSSHG